MAGPSGRPNPAAAPTLRLDKWLWQARFVKSRSLAAALIEGGHVRVNGMRVTRPGRDITTGDVLTFPQGRQIRVVRITALGLRRGPSTEAQMLYIDLQAPADLSAAPTALE
ncbi:MAG: RNA-binding S4 domain-containing protein [Tabrizicola sp.]|nr:RNA-binding S4 domain-containing protein [Tabrizicola sp.]